MYLTESKEETKKEETSRDEVQSDGQFMLTSASTNEKLRLCGIYGDISEETGAAAIYDMFALRELGTLTVTTGEESQEEAQEICAPFKFVISTPGGSATDMFAIYDVMREVREDCEIHTVGYGKVMSAGVLLLAAGTKGKRSIGKYCRVMIHGVVAGQQGHIHDIQNEFEETKLTQQMYIQALAEETDLTEAHIKKMMDKKTNVYLNAEQAVEYGIADIII